MFQYKAHGVDRSWNQHRMWNSRLQKVFSLLIISCVIYSSQLIRLMTLSNGCQQLGSHWTINFFGWHSPIAFQVYLFHSYEFVLSTYFERGAPWHNVRICSRWPYNMGLSCRILLRIRVWVCTSCLLHTLHLHIIGIRGYSGVHPAFSRPCTRRSLDISMGFFWNVLYINRCFVFNYAVLVYTRENLSLFCLELVLIFISKYLFSQFVLGIIWLNLFQPRFTREP